VGDEPAQDHWVRTVDCAANTNVSGNIG
jgi:hypothetical protein